MFFSRFPRLGVAPRELVREKSAELLFGFRSGRLSLKRDRASTFAVRSQTSSLNLD
jgi:hypothetical protein